MAKIRNDGSTQLLPLKVLHLDKANPRFGGRESPKSDEAAVLAEIVGQHGITDVISSIAANGYFNSEPLVGVVYKGFKDEVTIVEGNRRLSACLILAGDPRAEAYKSLAERYVTVHLTPKSRLPVQVYDWRSDDHRKQLLPYFGVRHIVGPSEWDSYAKAAWVADTLANEVLTLEEVRRMIGDDQRFTDRILEGYNFVQQVLGTSVYDARDSLRSGRGSFQEFPFSWVYTALGYARIRAFLGLPRDSQTEADPLDPDHLEHAGELLRFMFGAAGQNAAIDDSRQIGKLAKALGSKNATSALRKGASAEDAVDLLDPAEIRVLEFLRKSDTAMEKAIAVLSGVSEIDRGILQELEQKTDDLGVRYDNFLDLLEKLKTAPRRKRRKRS